MDVRVHDVAVTARQVSLPRKCPRCRRKVEAVVEVSLSDGIVEGNIIYAADPDAIGEFEPDSGAGWEGGDEFTVTGYRCGHCNAVLVAGEFTEVD